MRGGDAEGMAFYRALADAELFVLLEAEAEGDVMAPRVFDLADGPVLLAFDSEERLAGFSDRVLPYAALPGRVVAQLLAGQGIGLGINLGVAPSAMVLPPFAVDWLAETLAHGPEEAEARPQSFHPPKGLPQSLIAGVRVQGAKLGGPASRVHWEVFAAPEEG